MTDKELPAAKLSVLEICGAAPLTGTSGIKVHKLILGAWGTAKTVEVDFAGVLLTPTFLLEAVGRLVGLFPKTEIIEKLKTTGLSPADKRTLNGIVVNRYHAEANAEKARKRAELRRCRPRQ